MSAVTGIETIEIVWALFALHRLDTLNAVSHTPYPGAPEAARTRTAQA